MAGTGAVTVPPPDEFRQLLSDADRAIERQRGQDRSVQQALALPELREAVHLLLHGLAHGKTVRVEVQPDDYTPQQAASALGISRKLINKLIDTGELRHYTLPGSRHKKIYAEEIDRLRAERDTMRAGMDRIVDDLLDGGAED